MKSKVMTLANKLRSKGLSASQAMRKAWSIFKSAQKALKKGVATIRFVAKKDEKERVYKVTDIQPSRFGTILIKLTTGETKSAIVSRIISIS